MEQWNDGISFLRLQLTRREERARLAGFRHELAHSPYGSFATAPAASQRRPLMRVG